MINIDRKNINGVLNISKTPIDRAFINRVLLHETSEKGLFLNYDNPSNIWYEVTAYEDTTITHCGKNLIKLREDSPEYIDDGYEFDIKTGNTNKVVSLTSFINPNIFKVNEKYILRSKTITEGTVSGSANGLTRIILKNNGANIYWDSFSSIIERTFAEGYSFSNFAVYGVGGTPATTDFKVRIEDIMFSVYSNDNNYEPYKGTDYEVKAGQKILIPGYNGINNIITTENENISVKEVDMSWLDSYGTRLEYIESTGTQWIDTELKANQDTYMFIKMATVGKAGGQFNALFGARNGSLNQYWIFDRGCRFNTQDYSSELFNVTEISNLVEFKMENGKFYKDNLLLKTFANAGNFETTYTISLFGVRASSGNPAYLMSGRIYNSIMKQDGISVSQYLVPLKHNDGRIGMYDIVNRKFHPNKGTGSFIAGQKI